MKIACIYWKTSSVGGIATYLNNLRIGAQRAGDQMDILHSSNWKTKQPKIFEERQWIRGGDTNIWVDGEISTGTAMVRDSTRWLQENYDAVVFGTICPHQTKAYPQPEFLPVYEVDLPKAAYVMDGYWDTYDHWGRDLLHRVKGVLCPQESYANVVPKEGAGREVIVSPVPFLLEKGEVERDSKPLVVWPSQWKNIKGVTQFLEIVPDLIDMGVRVELYSNGIRYYQLRTEDVWKKAVGEDLFQGHHGNGGATFYGNVDHPAIYSALQRAWFTVNLQGMRSKKAAYKVGSYNGTESEALWYGACPILHETTLNTIMWNDIFISVKDQTEIPGKIEKAIESGFALGVGRQSKARRFVKQYHDLDDRYSELKEVLCRS